MLVCLRPYKSQMVVQTEHSLSLCKAKVVTLRVHVPHYYILGAQSPYIRSTLRSKYSLLRHMDPYG